MTEVESVETAPAVAQPAAEAPKPAARIKRQPKPDDTEVNKQMDKLEEQIQSYKKRIDEIRATFDKKRGAGGGSAEQQEIRNRLGKLRGEFDAGLVRGGARGGPACRGVKPPACTHY